VNGIVAGDYNGDGKTDLLLAGNDYSPEVETGRYDASIGCFLKGDGKGGFISLPVTQTGFYADGYVKGVRAVITAKEKAIIAVRNSGKPSLLIQNSDMIP
jgi:hypothetical protein